MIQGIVLEHATGLPLARSRVRLDAVTSTGVTAYASLLSGRTGNFVFYNLPEGLFVLTAQRDTYFPAGYGQRRAEGPGVPIAVSKDSNLFTELRLRKLPAITGRVLDENRVGIAGVSVLAYPAVAPLRSIASATTDDRGIYRIPNLKPGKYFVRSATHTLDDSTGLLPTFGPESIPPSEARIHETRLDNDTTDADVRPIIGAFFGMGGDVSCQVPGAPVTVVLSSETIRREAISACGGGYSFAGLTPGRYEILAEMKSEPRLAYFQEINLSRTLSSQGLPLGEPPEVQIEFRPQPSFPVAVMARRKDLYGGDGARAVPLRSGRAALSPGYWELHAALPSTHYLVDVQEAGFRRCCDGWHPDWFQAMIRDRGFSTLRFLLSGNAAIVRGRVLQEGQPVPGAPVFLWPVTAGARRSIQGPKMAWTDLNGNYKFEGLAPGEYRLLSSFDFSEVSGEIVAEAKAAAVTLAESQSATMDLAIYQLP